MAVEEAGMTEGGTPASALACWNDEQRRQVMDRFAVLRPYLEDGIPLSRTADHAGVALRTVASVNVVGIVV